MVVEVCRFLWTNSHTVGSGLCCHTPVTQLPCIGADIAIQAQHGFLSDSSNTWSFLCFSFFFFS